MLGKYDEKVKIFTSETRDAFINGKSFNLTGNKIYDKSGNIVPINEGKIGNLLNLFFRYDTFVQAFNQSYTQADILNNILQSINDNMFGLCNLQFAKESDLNNGNSLTIIDSKLPVKKPDTAIESIYRFKIGANGSIVKKFEFNMELSTLMQAQALYSTQLALNKSINDNKGPDDDLVAHLDEYSSADLSYAPNADKYFSINSIEVSLVKEAQKWNDKIDIELDVTGSTNTDTTDTKEKTADEKKKEMTEVLESKYIKFKLNPTDDKSATNTMIYLDSGLVLKHVKHKSDNSTALTYLNITLSIDGIAGISCGEFFHIDGVPEIYNINGYFQVTNVKHSIDQNGWETTIEAGYRILTQTEKENYK